jgi:hypothetical protein
MIDFNMVISREQRRGCVGGEVSFVVQQGSEMGNVGIHLSGYAPCFDCYRR